MFLYFIDFFFILCLFMVFQIYFDYITSNLSGKVIKMQTLYTCIQAKDLSSKMINLKKRVGYKENLTWSQTTTSNQFIKMIIKINHSCQHLKVLLSYFWYFHRNKSPKNKFKAFIGTSLHLKPSKIVKR